MRFETVLLDIRRGRDGSGWEVEVIDLRTGNKEMLSYVRIILCTGGWSQTHIPETLSGKSAQQAGFRGLVAHSSEFASHADQILSEAQMNPDYSVVVVGGGKSTQDISSHMARHGIGVTVVFEKVDGILAYPIQLPDWVRKSRCLGIFSPHIELRTCLECFLHTTTLGSMITRGFWNLLTWSSLDVLKIPKDSPLRNAHPLFWGIRTNDEGTGRKDGFHTLVNQGTIKLVASTRAEGYASDGESVMLRNAQTLRADAMILATGFSSSWTGIFTEKTIEDLGMGRHPPSKKDVDEWRHYKTLASPPAAHPRGSQWASSIYRGLVPVKNITKRDFAINGAVVSSIVVNKYLDVFLINIVNVTSHISRWNFTTNNGYGFEVTAHWISSYFLEDKMRLPCTVEQALAETERNAVWMRKRFPDMLLWVNESYSSGLAFWSWPQAIDELLDDMELPSMRSGGNWLMWPFKVITPSEIATLSEERQARREADRTEARDSEALCPLSSTEIARQPPT